MRSINNIRIILLGGALWPLLFFKTIYLHSQNHDYNWILDSRWQDTSILLTFNEPTGPQKVNMEMDISVSNSSMSNASGEFIFNSNGCFISGPNFETMDNGEGLNPGERHNSLCGRGLGYSAGHQTVLTIPHPGDDDLYFLIHNSYFIQTVPKLLIDDDALLFTLVDMSQNNGLGRVILKNQVLIGDTSTYSGNLTAVKHANNRDWWLFNPLQIEQKYARILVDESGMNSPQFQQIGDSMSVDGQGGGGAVFSPDGSKYVRWDPRNGIFIFDFNRETGLLSNYQLIDTRVDSVVTGGIAISPNSRFLYTTTLVNLFQYDLEANDIKASEVLIDTYDGFLSPFPCNFWQCQLGPDCKIYIASTSSCDRLGVIQYPDLKGQDCKFEQHSLDILGRSEVLPHFPNYRLGTGEVCDSSLIVSVLKIPSSISEFRVYPNPTSEWINLEGWNRHSQIQIIDRNGRILINIESNNDNKRVYVGDLISGIYFLRIMNGDRIATVRKISIF